MPPYPGLTVAAFHVPAVSVPTPVMPVYEPVRRPEGNVPVVILVAFVASMVADATKPDTADEAMAMAVLEAAVSCPCALTVNVGTDDAEPYEEAVTVVFARAIVPADVIVPPDRPVPAVMLVTVPDAVACAFTKAVVAICVELSDVAGVGALGVPVNVGDARGAAPSIVITLATDRSVGAAVEPVLLPFSVSVGMVPR